MANASAARAVSWGMNDPVAPLQDRPLVFVHIMKTAGNTLYGLLRSIYPPKRLLKLHMDPAQLTLGARAPARVLYGHIDMSVRPFLRVPDERYFTLVREPVERVVSLYYYLRTRPQDEGYEAAARYPLDEWVERSGFAEADNGMVRRLSGAMHAVPFGGCTREMLDRAKATISRMGMVGLSECFDASYVLMATLFGWPLRSYVSRNVNSDRPQDGASEPLRRAILRCNPFDAELYDFCVERFRRLLAQHDIAAKRELLTRAA